MDCACGFNLDTKTDRFSRMLYNVRKMSESRTLTDMVVRFVKPCIIVIIIYIKFEWIFEFVLFAVRR